MQDLDRVELADIHDPKALARAVHKQLGQFDHAIPVKDIALALGIDEVRQEPLDGCEGVLLTDRSRSRGRILVNSGRGRKAARFGIGHELGHFLLERHELGLDGRFICDRLDMRQERTARKYKKQEAEANEFSVELLAPACLTAPGLAEQPDIEVVEIMAKTLDISLEAAARCLVDRHDEPLAAVWTTKGIIRYMVRGPRFPWITREQGQAVSSLTQTHAAFSAGGQITSKMVEVRAAAWTNEDIPEVFEQVRIGKDGHSLTLLWATLAEEAED